MTREEARKAADVMLAYANGEEIERLREDGYEWVEDNFNPLFNWFANEYRIKPKPTYRPFKTKEECLAEMMKHKPFGLVKYYDLFIKIISIDDYGVEYLYYGEPINLDYSESLKYLKFIDGTPFGIKKE